MIVIYVDAFIGMVQAPSIPLLKHITRAILHSIHYVIVPPHTPVHKLGYLVAIKKLLKGEGAWCTEKEILGWIINGLTFCTALTSRKIQKLRKATQTALELTSLSLQKS